MLILLLVVFRGTECAGKSVYRKHKKKKKAKSCRCTVSMGSLPTLLCYIRVKFRSLPVGRPTGSCPPPQASPRSLAGRPSRCSPPAGPPPEGSQLCLVTRSRSPPPEPESWKETPGEPRHVRVTKGRVSGQSVFFFFFRNFPTCA